MHLQILVCNAVWSLNNYSETMDKGELVQASEEVDEIDPHRQPSDPSSLIL